MRLRVVVGVSVAWLLIGVVWGSQTALGESMQGTPVALTAALRSTLINSLPWIPATWIIVALAVRFPVTRASWKRTLWIHLLALPVVSWVANVFVVLGFWWMADVFRGWTTLARQAAFWGVVRFHVATTVYLATLVLTQGWIYLRDARARELRLARLEGQLAHARFRALNEQIRPHFLFNTLHTIGQLWRSGRDDDADAMLDRLGSLFQRVRSSTDRVEIALAEELDMVRDYLAIEEARFPDRLKAVVRATGAAGRCLVPPLLLQPLVENAIRHGVSASPEAGRVEVEAVVEGDRLVLEVRDDGPGLDHPTPSPGSGMGLANTRERLEHAFGDAHAMTIASGPTGGVRVRLELPARWEPDAWAASATDGAA